jgi:hypothetical protein
LELLAVLSPQTGILTALVRLARIKTDLIAFRLLNGPQQVRLLHLTRLDVMPFGYFPDLIHFHVYAPPLSVIIYRLADNYSALFSNFQSPQNVFSGAFAKGSIISHPLITFARDHRNRRSGFG